MRHGAENQVGARLLGHGLEVILPERSDRFKPTESGVLDIRASAQGYHASPLGGVVRIASPVLCKQWLGIHCRVKWWVGAALAMATLRTRLGRAVRRLRTEASYSQESFADRCRLHRTYMGAVERGETNISLDNIEKIARALGLTAGQLLLEAERDR